MNPQAEHDATTSHGKDSTRMSKQILNTKVETSDLPAVAGHQERKATLCIGLDMAWFGGSKSDPGSRYDFLAAALLDEESNVKEVRTLRIPLKDHDLEAELTLLGLVTLINTFGEDKCRIALAIDAPLQAVIGSLPKRTQLPKPGTVQQRSCEKYLSSKRKRIDAACGGAKGWHPNIQPGAPLAPRVEALLSKCKSRFTLWTPESSENTNLIIECFPAEAIWGAKRMGWFPDSVSAAQAKAYKKQKNKQLTALEVVCLVQSILLPFANVCKGNLWKDGIVQAVLEKILIDVDWKKNDSYPGGKMLDDAVDSMICLATAISYSTGSAHVWHDTNHPTDGHIIGPGTMQELLTGKIRLI